MVDVSFPVIWRKQEQYTSLAVDEKGEWCRRGKSVWQSPPRV